MNKKIKVAVVFGGQSSEHEVSRVSAQSVIQNLNPEAYDISMIGITKDGEWLRYQGDLALVGTGEWESAARRQLALTSAAAPLAPVSSAGGTCAQLLSVPSGNGGEAPVDVVFPVLHGPNGEDGSIQGLFQLAGVPYVGCGILASACGMDKEFSKLVFQSAGIATARHIKVMRSEIAGSGEVLAHRVGEQLGYPCFVKPANAGSSVGVSKVKTPEALMPALREAARYDSKILIEEFIDGREVECAVLGNEDPEASCVGEVVPCNDFYDYNAKYVDNKSETLIPANLSEELASSVQEHAVRAFKAMGCSGLSRVDFFIERGTDRVVLNEINTLPGFTSISMYSKLWAASGVSYPELVDRLVRLALERHEATRISIDRHLPG